MATTATLTTGTPRPPGLPDLSGHSCLSFQPVVFCHHEHDDDESDSDSEYDEDSARPDHPSGITIRRHPFHLLPVRTGSQAVSGDSDVYMMAGGNGGGVNRFMEEDASV